MITVTATFVDGRGRIVYLSAWCCVDGPPADYMRSPEYATSALNDIPPEVLIGDPASLGALRMSKPPTPARWPH